MVKITFKASYQNKGDSLVLYVKDAPNGTLSCPPDVCLENEWIPVELLNGTGHVNLEPGAYYFRYEARKTADATVQLQISQEEAVLKDITITINEGGITTGCGVFEVWS